MSNFSYYAIITICLYKIKYFFFEFQYTILAPLFSTFIFVVILSTISTYYFYNSQNNNYLQFVIPGVVMMIVIQTSYQYISETLIHMKQIGSFNDFLISPVSRIEIFFSFIITSMIISVFMGLFSIFIFNLFVSFLSINLYLIIYYIIITSLIFSSFGSIIGFLFNTWDVQQSVFNFIVLPISFLSGTFFSINSINPQWAFFLHYNPIYFIVDNFRQSFNQNHTFNFNHQFFLLLFIVLILIISVHIFKKGYNVIN